MKVAIVGAGPRGLSLCERLLAKRPEGLRLAIHLFDPELPGGRIWSKGSDPGFLMNVICQQVTLFTDDADQIAGPINKGPTLLTWCQGVGRDFLQMIAAPERIRAEADGIQENQYSSRALFGYYQQWFFQELLRKQTSEVTLVHRRHFVVGYEEPMVLISDGGMEAFDHIILATGHYPNFPNETERQLADYGDEHLLFYQMPEDAAFVNTQMIPDGGTVLIKGLGLTFFDYIQHFAVARGGRFKETPEGLVYQPSGREPIVYAGSGSGFPYYPRGENQRKLGELSPRYLLTEERLAFYRQQEQATGFFDELRQEVELAYYTTMLPAGERKAFAERYLTEGPDSALARYPLLATEIWDWDRFADPQLFTALTERGLQEFVAQQVAIAEEGNRDGGLAAAFETLKDHGGIIQDFLQRGLFSSQQYEEELLGFLGRVYGFITTGPPKERSRELLALLKAGVFHLLPPKMKVTCEQGHYVTKSLTGAKVMATALIEARVPTHQLTGTLNPLLQDLWDQGIISRYYYQNKPDLATEAVRVQQHSYLLINKDKEVVPGIYCLGIPLEGADWLTTQIPFKGRHNHFLWQTDIIAGHILQSAE